LAGGLVDAGADVVLGSHPHVLQPMEVLAVERSGEPTRTAFIVHSLGNFMSNQRERYRDTGVMVRLVFEKNLKTKATALVAVEYVPVWVDDTDGARKAHRVLPIAEAVGRGYQGVNEADRTKMRQAWEDTTTHLGSAAATSADPAAVVFWSARPGR
jgi:poly-gamma-glutamate synthesis protein (capsule biosynthesis protein)